MENNKKTLLIIIGIVIVIGLSFFTYQNYHMPEFENKTITEGLQISVPKDSNFIEIGNNTFHDNKTNLDIKLLKSENDVLDSKLINPEKTINNGSNIIKVFENYTVVTDKNSQIGIKLSNITDSNRNIAMEIAENAVISSSLKSQKIGEEKAKEIAQKYENKLNRMLWTDATSTFTDISLTKYKNKTVYKVTFIFQQDVSNLGGSYSTNTETIYSYIDAYYDGKGKVIAIEEVTDNKNDPLYRGGDPYNSGPEIIKK